MLILLTTLVPDNLSAATEGDFEYSVADGQATITGYTGLGGAVTIPSTLDGYPVIAIGASSFQDNNNITSIMIPDSVTTISDNAFQGCVALTSVTIGKEVISIGLNAFAYSTSLISISFHELTSPSAGSDWILGTHASIEGHALRSSNFPAPGGSFNGLLMGSYIASDYLYVIGSGQVTITGYVGAGGDITIPSTIGGYPVTVINNAAFSAITTLTSVVIPDSVRTIGDRAFRDCNSLTSVTIPGSVTLMGTNTFYNCVSLTTVTIGNGVTTINDWDFGYCTSLTSIIIPNSVTSIGSYAFFNCSALTSVTIGKGVTTIGSYAFRVCSALTVIDVDPDNSIYASIDGVLYDKNITTLVIYPGGSSGPFTIPNSVTSIGDYAFASSSITSVTIPSSVTSIGNNTFAYCPSLASVTIGNGVTNIGYNSFYHCTALTSIDLPESVTSIGNSAFAYSGLTSINIPGSATIGYSTFAYSNLTSVTIGFGVSSISTYAFQYCSALASIVIPEGVTSIGDYAFYHCSALTSIYVPDSVTSIGGSAFAYSGLISLTIGNGVTTISDFTFRECTSLVSVTLGNNVSTISDYAFYYCTSLTSITIPGSVTTIGNYAFSVCRALTSINIPSSVNSIGNQAFLACTALNSFTVDADNPNFVSIDGVLCSKDGTILIAYPGGLSGPAIIPGSVTTIGSYAFGYSTITSITIPDRITSIGSYAFEYCKALTSVYFGNGMTTVSPRMFYFCSALTSVTIPDSVTSISESAFYYCTALTSITIPDSVTSIGNAAFAWTALTTITIPDGVTYIGEGEFWGCTSLTSVTIGSGVTTIGMEAFIYCPILTSITFRGLTKPTSVGTDWLVLTPSTIRGHAYYSSNFPLLGGNFRGLIMGEYIPEYAYTVTDGNATITGYIGPGGPAKIPTTLGGYPVIAIGDYAFEYNTNITSMSIPDSVTTIGSEAFYDCSALTSVTLGNRITSIGEYAFARSALTSITIPGSVTSIDGHAFAWSDLTSITLLNSVTSIGSEAFYYCTSLTSVTLGNGVTSIGDFAFSGCYALTSVTIPASVDTIGDYAFIECSALTAIEVDLDNPNYASSSGVLYSKDMTVLIQYPAAISGAFVIPDGVTTIGKSAFYWCSALTNVTIPSSVTSIENSAFYFCTALTSIIIPNSVTSIEDATFSICSALTSITIPESVTSIGDWAFRSCSALTSITIPESVTSIGISAFEQCTALTSIIIPSGVASIDNSTFDHCSNLVSVTIPNDVTSIGSHAFYYCTSLTSITIPNNVTSIGSYAFSRTGLTSGTIPEGVTTIGDYAYFYCTSLISMTISSSVTSIGEGAFVRCNHLISITFLGLTAPTYVGSNWIALTQPVIRGHAYPASNFPAPEDPFVTFHGLTMGSYIPCDYAFTFDGSQVTIIGYYGSGGAITIPSMLGGYPVVAIGNSAFQNKALITSVTIPNSVTTIGFAAFSGCSALTSATIGSGVTFIDVGVFIDCCALTQINVDSDNLNYASLDGVLYSEDLTILVQYPLGLTGPFVIPNGVVTIGNDAFRGCSGLTSVTIPDSVTSIGEGAFAFSALTSVISGGNVGTIGAYAFNNCTSLTSITFHGLIAPTNVGAYWIDDTNASIVGHALRGSSFPAPGGTFNGLPMGSYIASDYVYVVGSGQVTITGYVGAGGDIIIPSTIGGYPVTVINNNAFRYLTHITSVVIADSIVTIGDFAFEACTSLTSVTIPGSVTLMGRYLFSQCRSLESVTIGYGVTTIGFANFASCTSLTSVTIPGSVTLIGDSAFQGCSALTAFTIPDSVTTIGRAAFYDCSALTAFTIPDSVTTIGNDVFYSCDGLTTVSIGKGVTSMGTRVFSDCGSLTSINVDSENPNYTSIDGVLYNKNVTKLIAYPGGLSGSFIIPDGVTEIGDCAFELSALTSVIIPDSVITIGNSTFRQSALTSVIIPDSVSSIGFYSFYECSSLSSATIGDNVTSLKTSTFKDCTALSSVIIGSKVTSIGYQAFYRCEALTAITLPYGLTTIINEAFSYSGLTSITIPESVTTIGGDAFSYSDLTSITIPNSLATISDRLFYRCYDLTSVIIGSGVTTIGGYAFFFCPSLTSITFHGLTAPTSVGNGWISYTNTTIRGHAYYSSNFPLEGESFYGLIMGDYIPEFTYTVTDSKATITGYIGPGGAVKIPPTLGGFPVTAIGASSFQYNANITSLIITDGVKSIDRSAFYKCSALTSVTIPASVTSIGDQAFGSCPSLTSVTIGGGVTTFGMNVFALCPSLASVTISEGVTTIGYNAFWECTSLTSITIPDSVGTIEDQAFVDCSALTSVTLGNGVTSIGTAAFAYCTSLTSVTIPSSVSSIGSFAFGSCTSLTVINVHADNPNYTSLDGVLYNKDLTVLIQYPGGSSGPFVIPNSVTTIANYAFYESSGLSSITIPGSVGTIGAYAFRLCDALTSVTIPSSVTVIGTWGFGQCANLTSLIFHGLTAPTVGSNFVTWSNSSILGHAYYASNFPAPGGDFYGLVMGAYIPEGYTYTVADGNATITGYLGAGGDITIPTTLGGCPVIAIGDNAFLYGNVTSVIIPDSVTTIGNRAFYYSTILTSVTIGNGVTTIGNSAFSRCSDLTSVTIPDSVNSIGNNTFQYCTSLSSVTIGKGVASIVFNTFSYCPSLTVIDVDLENPNYASVGGVLYSKDMTTLILCPGGFSGPLVIPDSVTSILYHAFAWSAITSVTIPDSVTTIGDYAFRECQFLTSVTIPDSVTTIGDCAFRECQFLTSVTIGSGVTSISEYAFAYCDSLTSITIPDSVTSIEFGAFGQSALTSVTIPSSVNTIGGYAFYYCTSLTSVAFHGLTAPTSIGTNWISGTPSTIRGHAYYASDFPAPGGDFYGLIMGEYIPEGYTYTVTDGNATITGYLGEGGNITIPTTLGGCPVIAIGNYAFQNNANITNLTVPSSVQTVGIGAFSNCANMITITIGSGVISIGDHAFDGASALTKISVDVMNPVYTSRGYVFLEYIHRWQKVDLGCLYDKELTTLIRCPEGIPFLLIPGYDDVVTTILDGACRGCRFITSVYLPWSINSIGDQAFYGCTGLISVEMLYHVTSIGEQAFAGCSNLTTVHLGDSVTNIGEGAFMGCGHLTDIWMPNGITSIQPNLFQACSSLTSIIIPVGVTSIGDSAFSDCTSLTSITFLGLKTPTTGDGWITNTNGALLGHAYEASEFPATGSSYNGLTMGSYLTCDYDFTFDGSQVTITGYTGSGGEISIPDEIGGYPVTIIGDRSFQYNGNITSLTIPGSVDIIGEWAFDSCSALESVTIVGSGSTVIGTCAFQLSSLQTVVIGGGVRTIGEHAFGNCHTTSFIIEEGLETICLQAFDYSSISNGIFLPSTVTSISSMENDLRTMGAFFYCMLPSIGVAEGNPIYASLNGVLYDKTMSTLLVYPSGRPDTSFTVPDTVTKIDNYSFFYCQHLVSVTVPGSVNAINMGAFSQSEVLSSVLIENGLTLIGERAFMSCTALSSVTFPDSLTYIGDSAFWGCTSLSAIELPEGLLDIGSSAFYGCPITTLDIPDSVTTIGAGAFSACKELVTVNVGSGVESMGGAFSGCSALVAINVDDDNLYYASMDGVLYNETITALIKYPAGRPDTSYVMPDTVTLIMSGALIGCSNLLSLTLSDALEGIEGRSIGCAYITSLTIPSGVTYMGRVFSNCNSLLNIDFLGMTPPVGDDPMWLGAPPGALGHAYSASGFPVPGERFGGLLMSSYLADVTFSQTGVDISNANIVLTVDGTTYLASQLPITFTWYSGTVHTFSWSDVVGIDPVTRFGWQSSSGLCTDAYGTITVPDIGGSISAVYATQHLISFTATGLDSDAGTNTVLTVGTTTYAWNELPTDIWVNDGTAFYWSSPVPTAGERVFTLVQHSGLASPIITSGTDTADYFKSLTVSGNVYITGTTTGAADWHMQLWKDGSQVGPDAITDASGAYSFTVTLPGNYQVREVLKDGWTETSPELTYSAGDGTTPSVLGHDGIIVTSGIDVTGLDFENFEWLTVSGVKFFDANGNSLREADEPLLQNWAMSIERDGAPYLAPILTDSDGRYEFIVKDPGCYVVAEQEKYLWVQTCPSDGTYSFTARSGHDEAGLDFGNWLGGPVMVTTSDLSMFDTDGDTSNGRQFKLIFTPDVPDFPNMFTLTASNPGQFYLNAFFLGSVSKGDTFVLSVPFPFVTQGTEPVHVYSGLNTNPLGWLVPGADISSLFGLSSTAISWSYDGQSGFSDRAVITLTALDDHSGFLYINLHLDYGLKKNIGALSPDYSNDAEGVLLTIEEGGQYAFSVIGPGDYSADDAVRNANSFKRNPGFGGLVLDADGDPVVGATIEIWLKNVLIGTAETDDDGWYMLDYKHTGKPTIFTLKLHIEGELIREESVTVKTNSFSMVIFDLSAPSEPPPPPEEPPTKPPKPPKK